MNILVLEDDRLLNKAITFSLERLGYHVYSCFNGNEALVVLENKEIDVIVSDLMTPQKTGLNLLITLKEAVDFKTPVIIISGLQYAEKLIEQYQLNCIAFFKKPIDPQKIIDEISRIKHSKK